MVKLKKRCQVQPLESSFAPTHASIFTDKREGGFLKSQELTPLPWYRYIGDVFFIWTHGEK